MSSSWGRLPSLCKLVPTSLMSHQLIGSQLCQHTVSTSLLRHVTTTRCCQGADDLDDFMRFKQKVKKKRHHGNTSSWDGAPVWDQHLVFEQLRTRHAAHHPHHKPHLRSRKRHSFRGWTAVSDDSDGDEYDVHGYAAHQRPYQVNASSRRKRQSRRRRKQSWGDTWEHRAAADEEPWEAWVREYLRSGPYKASKRSQDPDRSWYEQHWEQQASTEEQTSSSWSGYSSAGWWEHYRQGNHRQQSKTGAGGAQTATHSESVLAHLGVLGLPANTHLCPSQLKAAFHRCAMRWHPDRHNSSISSSSAEKASEQEAAERFKAARAAYEALRALC